MEGQIEERKDSHIKISKEKDVQYKDVDGWEDIQLVHNALPECNLESVDCSCEFLKKSLASPIMISAMTGGTALGKEINLKLAEAANEKKVAFALGSCRAILKNEGTLDTFRVRQVATEIPLIANIGGVQLKEYTDEQILSLVSKTEADAIAIHLNPLQEAIQPEGDVDFSRVYLRIKSVCQSLDVPVIVKETGAGINGSVARRLFDAGVEYIESSGRGGTSWSKVEYERGGKLPGFSEWGYMTVPSAVECALQGHTIASGGIRTGVDVAKAITIGAKMVGAAMPFLKTDNPKALIDEWEAQLKTCMFLTGSKDLQTLSDSPVLITGKSGQILSARGIDTSAFSRRENSARIKEEGYYL
jgi:isopentenyl-diphosphate Delta-isomerase